MRCSLSRCVEARSRMRAEEEEETAVGAKPSALGSVGGVGGGLGWLSSFPPSHIQHDTSHSPNYYAAIYPCPPERR